MSEILIYEHNAQTGEISSRLANDEELNQIEIDKKDAESQEKRQKAKNKAKAELLAKLGITEEEAKLLLG